MEVMSCFSLWRIDDLAGPNVVLVLLAFDEDFRLLIGHGHRSPS